MTLNKFLRKCLVPAIVVGVLVYIVIVKYHISIPQIKINTTNSKKYTSETCPNSFTQLLVRDTCYVCPEGSQGISWVSPGYVQCSTKHNTVLNAIQK